ncbi:hypothetical protein IWT25_01290 [Secundilactobacillus pentosiphilus]|uniref:Uncharacterized protein n=1 Tax=Secundilactobacillus pentosiphilus TaxID=1714682 RepID=A0A1Z5IW20_9LACO|nr:hypothetical protein IWT25_01290 [Secundilactobacillus pentosiphilus]
MKVTILLVEDEEGLKFYMKSELVELVEEVPLLIHFRSIITFRSRLKGKRIKAMKNRQVIIE